MHRVRIVLTQISSIEPVGAIKSSLSDLAEVTAAFVPPRRERRRCSLRSTAIGFSPGAGHCRPDGGLSGTRTPIATTATEQCCRSLVHLITVAQDVSGKELETFLENSRWEN